VLELYFVFYFLPKKMTRLARERGRSAVRWSLLAIVTWFGVEFAVIFGIGLAYGAAAIYFDWPEELPGSLAVVAYLGGLGSAILSSVILGRLLSGRPRREFEPEPPPPPQFSS
jgi:membrane associated rhomboid family serine protease